MSLDVLNPIHLKKIKQTGTMGVIDYSLFDKDIHYFVDPNWWGVKDEDSFSNLPNGGGNFKDQTGCIIGDKYYVYGGENSSYQKTGQTLVYEITDYQTGNGFWTYLASGQTRKEACMDTNGVDCFAFGGNTGTGGGTSTNTMQKYTVSTNTWSILHNGTGGPIPVSRHDCCVLDNYMYCYGGWPGENSATAFDQLWRYDLSMTGVGGWEQLQGSSYPMINMVIVPYDGKIYSFGGVDPILFNVGGGTTIDEYRSIKNTLIYDPSQNIWSQGGYCPFVGSETNGYVWDDKFYVYGYSPKPTGGYDRAIYVYDFITDVWTMRFTGGRAHAQCAVDVHVPTGNMYLYGGTTPNYSRHLDIWFHNNNTLAIRKV